MTIIEPHPPRLETFCIVPKTIEAGKNLYDAMAVVRNMIVMALGCIKELSAQAVEKYRAPGMRIVIGEIISCLAQAKHMVDNTHLIKAP